MTTNEGVNKNVYSLFLSIVLTIQDISIIIIMYISIRNYQEDKTMTYVCDVCGWEYNEEEGAPEYGIAPGTKWEDLPDDFECPLCFVGKDQFSVKE